MDRRPISRLTVLVHISNSPWARHLETRRVALDGEVKHPEWCLAVIVMQVQTFFKVGKVILKG